MWWKIIRLRNLLILNASAVLFSAALYAVRQLPFDWRETLYLCFIMSALLVAANLHNDIVDVDIDKLKGKPTAEYLHQNRQQIVKHTVALYILSGALAIFKPDTLPIVALCILLLILYNLKLKRLPLIGNIAVAVCSAFPFALIGRKIPATDPADILVLLYVLCAFLCSFSRELAKDVEDAEYDQAVGMRTFPIIHGHRAAFNLAMILTFLQVPALLYCIAIIPDMALSEHFTFFVAVAVVVSLSVAAAAFMLIRKFSASSLSALFKVEMAAAVLCLPILIF